MVRQINLNIFYTTCGVQLKFDLKVLVVGYIQISRLPNVPEFLGQSRILNPVPGVPGGGYSVPDLRGFKFKKKLAKIVIKLAKINIS